MIRATIPFGASGEFGALDSDQEIRRLAAQGVGATSIFQVFSIVVQVASMLVLARLLTPSDFGLVTMVTTFSLLFMNAGGNGFTEVILQRQRLHVSLVNNLFWLNLALGAVLTVTFAAAGSLLGSFYDNRLVVPVAAGLSLTILATSLSVVHQALLMRAMRFQAVYASSAIARVASIAVSVLLAWRGWGYWALVVGAIVQPAGEALWAWTICRWMPGVPRRNADTWAALRFALNVYGRFASNYFARNVDNLLIGWRFDAVALGLYKKAYDLFAFSTILKSFSPVAVSALSRVSGDPERHRFYILKTISVVAFVGVGFGAALTLVGSDLIVVLLGAKWVEAGHIFTYFAPGMAATFLYATHGWIHLSSGSPDRWLRWGVLEAVLTSGLFIVALPWGPVGIATASSVSLWILVVPSLWYAGKPIGLDVPAIVSAIWKYMVASAIAVWAGALVTARFHLQADTVMVDAGIRLSVGLLSFGLVYVLIVALLHGGGQPFLQLGALLRDMLPSKYAPQGLRSAMGVNSNGPS